MNHTYSKRAVLLLLTASLLASCACGGAATPSNDTTAAGASDDTTPAAPVISEDEDELPELDFGGVEFKMLAAQSTAYRGYLLVEEETGDVLDDAIFYANRAVEERLNIDLTQEIQSATQANETGEKIIYAGDHVYDVISFTDRNVLNYAVQDMVLSYSDMPYINLDKAYWCRSINDSMTIGGNRWCAYGDFNLSVYDYTFALAFNKGLLEDLKLEDPYDLVESGKWTYEKFRQMGVAAVSDLNGDTKMDATDRYGWSCIPKQLGPVMWVAAGAESVKKDKNDLPYFSMANDTHFIEVYQKYFDIAYNDNNWYVNSVNGDITKELMFSEGRALFQTTSFGLLDDSYYREMKIDFGVLPHPKWDEAQDRYYSRVEGGSLIAIPVTTKNREMVGAVLEAMSSESHKTVIPAYFEIALKTKYTRDDESSKMFDLIMDTRVYDLGDTFWCSQIRDSFMKTAFESRNRDIVSVIASNKDSVSAKIQETVDKLGK